jgi:hypothetical protein
MPEYPKIVSNRQWQTLIRHVFLIGHAMVEMTGWVAQREAQRMTGLSKTALIWARTQGKIDSARVGKEPNMAVLG